MDSCTYNEIRQNARCLASVQADTDRGRFLVGTLSLHEGNEIHLLEYLEDNNEIVCERKYLHPGEVWFLTSCPTDMELMITCDGTDVATMWKMEDITEETTPSATGDVDPSSLEQVAAFTGHKGSVKSVLWNPAGEGDSVVTLDDSNIRQWKLGDGHSVSKTAAVTIEEVSKITNGSWNPHHIHVVAAACEKAIRAWDLRSSKSAFTIENPHAPITRSIDFNPNKPNLLVSAGDDRKIKIWDSRQTAAPVVTMENHSHWVWKVEYNRSHDLLLLSSGTDSLLNLYCLPSVSSSEQNGEIGVDRLECSFETHDESIYSFAWSAANSFSFASLSYDGRVCVNHVPQALKYSILL